MIEIDEQTKQLLQKLGFTEGKNGGDYQTEIEGGYAHVDFRKENGRRWAIVNRNFVKEPDTIEILKQFKEERDKLLQSSSAEPKGTGQGEGGVSDTSKLLSTPDTLKSSGDIVERQNNNIAGDAGQETILNNQSSIHTPPDVKIVPAPNSPNLYEFFYGLVGAGGIIEIFGDTGTLKSNLCTEVCKAAHKINKRFYYLDTEGKVGLFNKKFLGAFYQYQPIWDEILKTTDNMKPCDLLIVDSVGFPSLTEYASMKSNEKGNRLLELIALLGKSLKVWAFNNKALVFVVNQPQSDFMKDPNEVKRLNPFGDKSNFAPNIILRSNKTIIPGHYDPKQGKAVPPKSIGTFTSHRSTDFMDDMEILSITKNDNEVIIEIPPRVLNRLKELKG